jgi:peptide/nickel transport system substrate-binding protein
MNKNIFLEKKWIVLIQALPRRERFFAWGLIVVSAVGLLAWLIALYISATMPIPKAGGKYIEGIVGQPAYINPLLSQTSESDADLSALVYAGLFVHDASGQPMPRLAESFALSSDGKEYTVKLRENIRFQDGTPMTVDDVIFTLQAIQDPAYRSPLRQNWQGVEISSPDERTIVFSLKKAYFGFLENLTVGILPKHIWQSIPPEKFALAESNLMPIGAGPYQFSDLKKDAEGNILWYELKANETYFSGRPYIDTFNFRFYPDEDSLFLAYKQGEVMGMASIRAAHIDEVLQKKSTRLHELHLPRAFSVFFNTSKSAAVAFSEVREALSLATDRSAIVRDTLSGRGIVATTPFLPFMNGYDAEISTRNFDMERAKSLLDEKGWKQGDDGVRERQGTRLEFELLVPEWPELERTASQLQGMWEGIGAKVTITTQNIATLQQDRIRPREYHALLFGQASLADPDPYSFWHSKEREDPGLNLSSLDEQAVDDILLQAREITSSEERAGKYADFQRIFLEKNPAIFLYSPSYLYVTTDRIQGIRVETIDMPSDRFGLVSEWYLNTKRVWKP